MKVYTYSEARQNLASLLDQVAKDGEVRVKRRDGQRIVSKPAYRNPGGAALISPVLGFDTAKNAYSTGELPWHC